MIALTLAELAEITAGELHGDAEVILDGPVVTDAREAETGSLYIARVGEHADGHAYVDQAAERGAAAALTTRAVDGLPCVVVEDTQAAFVALSRALLERVEGLHVIGITGSSGKTSTKDLLGSVLAADGETIAPQGSYNSEVGVPLTVCRVTESTRHLVVEMGARGGGHVEYLTRIAPPQVGIVLNVGHAHVGEFGSLDAVATAKSELVRALPPDGLAVLNADDPRVRAMAQVAPCPVLLVGESADADVRASAVTLDEGGRPTFAVHAPFGTAQVTLPLVGRHHVGNALAALAAAHAAGMPLESIARAMATAHPTSRWRMEVTERPDGVRVVNDAYNANPDSMAAALRAMVTMNSRRGADDRPGRCVAVLGAMLELGPESPTLHREVGELAGELGIDIVLSVGDEARSIAEGARSAGVAQVDEVGDVDAAHRALSGLLRSGDVVLLKSSRDAGLRFLGDRLATESMEVTE
ncbi:UDP-N-acetylmuramoyl-tripeptide--D-alanyl-D-alanine ligase [Marihabitans asiaticum]|uniref:UDP-N-acetylmuramoyl-tripeptide--D-alanyl-D-alanine ligase n=1 Tax=Marihabitans asiaticum TaxID=415218 RepID=A0A560WA27_9MICO|nr:UDP-N-acetylmuramoyl-tripeptide--D-alanyl-D-alanine ligase [Marihabitans asiaticum]TWD14472.1 UDP-N-acetylmuramoyl-tripeptide--D-alanyl-D-alanine ligase [Marihabitans asiaticum]